MANAWILWSKAPSASASQCLTSSQREEIKTTTTCQRWQQPLKMARAQRFRAKFHNICNNLPGWILGIFGNVIITSWTKSWTFVPPLFEFQSLKPHQGINTPYLFLVAKIQPLFNPSMLQAEDLTKKTCQCEHPRVFLADVCVGRCCLMLLVFLLRPWQPWQAWRFLRQLWEVFFFVACHGDCGKSWSELKWIQSTKRTINQKAVTKTKSLHVFTSLREASYLLTQPFLV